MKKEVSLFSPEVVTVIIAFAALIITSILTFARNKWEKQTAQRTLFEKFNERFDELNEALNKIRDTSLKGEEMPLSFAPTKRRPSGGKWQEIIQDYLNLCCEEYLWHKKSLVDKEVWKAWKAGMLFYLEAPAFDTYFESQRQYSISYYGLFDELRWIKPKNLLNKTL